MCSQVRCVYVLILCPRSFDIVHLQYRLLNRYEQAERNKVKCHYRLSKRKFLPKKKKIFKTVYASNAPGFGDINSLTSKRLTLQPVYRINEDPAAGFALAILCILKEFFSYVLKTAIRISKYYSICDIQFHSFDFYKSFFCFYLFSKISFFYMFSPQDINQNYI